MSLDGTLSTEAIAARDQRCRSGAETRELISQFRDLGLLDSSSAAEIADSKPKALRVRLPRSASRLLGAAGEAFTSRGGILLGGAFIFAGCIAAISHWTDITHHEPWQLSSADLPALIAAIAASALAHELAHAAVLISCGGRVRTLGIMWMYCLPTPFCDTSDAWRLPWRSRCLVALAGVWMNCVIGSAAAIVFAVLQPIGTVAERDLALVAVINAALVVSNLVPFARLDGYMALESALRWPGFLDDAIAMATGWLQALARTRRPRVLGTDTSLPAVLFGLVALACHLAFLFAAAYVYLRVILFLGAAPWIAWSLLASACVYAVTHRRACVRCVTHSPR